MAIGCRPDFAWRVCGLMEEKQRLCRYLEQAQSLDCFPITRLHDLYPVRIKNKLDTESPGCLWAKGDLSALTQPMIALVGSRQLHLQNRKFAYEVGKQAALQGYTLVSGNATGADQEAQNSCLEHGGMVVSVVADALGGHELQACVLYLSEEDFDQEFSAQRALSRNRIIHILGEKTFVAQCTMGKGGTWDGSLKNLRFGWSPLFCYNDGSDAMDELLQRGADAVQMETLSDISALKPSILTMI